VDRQHTSTRHTVIVAAFTLLSWLGGYVHNSAELPQLTPLSPENSLPALLSVLLFLAWWRLPFRRLTTAAFLAWALIQGIVGGVLSVVPFPFWPYDPPQTLWHYAAHVIYAAAQIPLILALVAGLRSMPDEMARNSRSQESAPEIR
jgi:hypothetical protein